MDSTAMERLVKMLDPIPILVLSGAFNPEPINAALKAFGVENTNP